MIPWDLPVFFCFLLTFTGKYIILYHTNYMETIFLPPPDPAFCRDGLRQSSHNIKSGAFHESTYFF